MNDIAQKPPQEKLLDVVKDKSNLLLTRVQSFTSKEVSDACKGMNERLLERTALMCERIANNTNPSPAVLTVVNLSKKGCDDESLCKIIEKLEGSSSWFLRNSERLSQLASPEQFLKSIPHLDAISRWDKRVYAPRVSIDEENMIMLTSELLTTLPDAALPKYIEFGRICAERKINPEELYATLLNIAKKNPTEEQFGTILKEFSMLLPTLKEESEIATPFFMDWSSDEKKFVSSKPEWTLHDLSQASSSLPIEEFIKKLKDTQDYYELKSLFREMGPNDELVVVLGSKPFRPDLKKYGELLDKFTKLLSEVQTPEDPRLAEMREAMRMNVGYNEEHCSELCKAALAKWKGRWERWHNKKIAENWIPNELGVLLSRMSAVQEESPEVASIKDALAKNKVNFKMSTELVVSTTWPKDMNACVMDNDGRVKGYIMNLPFEAQEEGRFIGEGGASVPGPGFTIFSDSVRQSQIKDFKLSLFGASYTYQLPSGYTTLRLPTSEQAAKDVLLETMHIDTVMAVIPSMYTKDRKPLLLIDPHYYKEVSENSRYKEEFHRLLTEQSLENRVVVIPEEEAHLNPANLAFVEGEKELILMNDAKKTIEMLVEKGVEKERIITVHVDEMHAFRGGIGCCISHVRSEEILQ